ncbi:hypothetical protein Hanom_Chr05g00399721 [Helianthus anomalus]
MLPRHTPLLRHRFLFPHGCCEGCEMTEMWSVRFGDVEIEDFVVRRERDGR